MKAKRIMAALLGTVVCLSALTACGGQNDQGTQNSQGSTQSVQSDSENQSEKTDESNAEKSNEESKEQSEQQSSTDTSSSTHTLVVRDAGKNEKIVATFFNTTTDASEDVTMNKTDESSDYFVYSCDSDVTKYNMVRLTYGDMTSMDVAFNKFVSGWYLWNDELLPYVAGKEPKYEPKYETKTFKFDGYDKNVYIWTPEDYDAKADTKYSVIYMLDGQTVLSPEIGGEMQCWDVSEHVTSMMASTDYKSIIVAVETRGENTEEGNGAARDDELIPDIGGEFADKNMTSKKRGNALADFICGTVMPYVDETYNVYTDAANTSVCGSSFGGLFAFYAGMEHPDEFGTIGALSPSFWVYGEDAWKSYFSGKKFDENSPFIYFYSGSYAKDTGTCAAPAYNYLVTEANYPKDKLVFNKNEQGEHFVPYWRNVYPEFLEAMFTGRVSALESGVEIVYKDTTVEQQPAETSIDPDDPALAVADNYLYYDNSETKWEKVYAYWWGNKPLNKITGEVYGNEWPGVEMEKIGDSDIYRIVVPVGPTGFIFDSGVTDDEVKNGTIAYQTADLVYSAAECAGKIYKIDMSEDPAPGRGVEKTKFKYNKGEWKEYKAS